MDSQIIEKALGLVRRAKAYNADDRGRCWHGRLGGIQGYDSQYGWPVECYGCESDDDQPPFETVEVYGWALRLAKGLPRPVVAYDEDLCLD
jgi:hypothetical protein